MYLGNWYIYIYIYAIHKYTYVYNKVILCMLVLMALFLYTVNYFRNYVDDTLILVITELFKSNKSDVWMSLNLHL